jgi:biopolymer transport protein ExbB
VCSSDLLLAFIGTTAAVSPLLGLLGTVTGMITTFELITIFGTGDARNLSSGISEALVTTEFGLIVAIPALILHAILSRKANSLLGTMEQQAIAFTNGLKIARETT